METCRSAMQSRPLRSSQLLPATHVPGLTPPPSRPRRGPAFGSLRRPLQSLTDRAKSRVTEIRTGIRSRSVLRMVNRTVLADFFGVWPRVPGPNAITPLARCSCGHRSLQNRLAGLQLTQGCTCSPSLRRTSGRVPATPSALPMPPPGCSATQPSSCWSSCSPSP